MTSYRRYMNSHGPVYKEHLTVFDIDPGHWSSLLSDDFLVSVTLLPFEMLYITNIRSRQRNNASFCSKLNVEPAGPVSFNCRCFFRHECVMLKSTSFLTIRPLTSHNWVKYWHSIKNTPAFTSSRRKQFVSVFFSLSSGTLSSKHAYETGGQES